MQISFLWLMAVGVQQAYLALYELNESINKTVAVNCISQIATILSKAKLAVWHLKEQDDFILEVLKKVKVPVVVNAAEHPKQRGMETRVINELVIIFDNIDIEQVLSQTLWNSETRFLLVTEKAKNFESDFEIFWKFKVINVFEMFSEGEDIIVYSFLPYEKGYCGVSKLLVVDKYMSRTGDFINSGAAFKDSVRIKNMNECPLNITVVDVKPNVIFEGQSDYNGTTHIQGIEGKLISEVAKKLNFNATFATALDGIGWGWIHPSPHGAVGEVFMGRSDFAIGLLAPTIERYENLDISLPYNGEECITYGVPKGAGFSTPNWITILFFEFGFLTWILIFFSFILIFNTIYVINKLSRIKWFYRKMDIILYLFSSCLGLPVKIPHYLTLRLSLICWIIFTFIVTVAYKSAMGSKLTVPNRDVDINTFKQLLESNLELTGYKNMLRLLQYNNSEPTIEKMVERFKVTDFDINYAVNQIAVQRKIAHVRHTTTFLYYSLINPKAKGHIHVLRECVLLYHPIVIMRKHSPFLNGLNQMISSLMESGITKRWRSEYIYNVPPPIKPFHKLSNKHMYGVFCILCCGYFISFLIFAMENVKFYFEKSKVKN